MAQTATVTLSANATAVVASLRTVQSEIARTAQVCATRARTFAEAFSPLVISIQGITGAIRKISAAWSGAAEFENIATRIAPLVGGLEASTELARDLRRQAVDGTETFESLAAVAGKLAAVFHDTGAIREWTRRFHDLAAGTGESATALVERFVRASASGTFNAGFFDIFAARGVNLYEPLARELNMSEAELRKFAATGGVSFDAVKQQLTSLTDAGGQFAGMAKKLSSTAGGTFNSLKEQLSVLAAEFGEPINAKLVPAMNGMIAAARNLETRAKSAGTAFFWIAAPATLIAGATAAAAAIFKIVTATKALALSGAALSRAHPLLAAISAVASVATVAAPAIASFFSSIKSGSSSATNALTETERVAKNLKETLAAAADSDAITTAAENARRELRSSLRGYQSRNNYTDTNFFGRSASIERQRNYFAEGKTHLVESAELQDIFALEAKINELEAKRRRELAAESATAAAKKRVQEREAALARYKKIETEITELRRDAAKNTYAEAQNLILADTGVDSFPHINDEIAALTRRNALTEEEEKRVRQLIAARKQLKPLYEAAQSEQQALEDRKAALEAELAGTAALVALKTKQHRESLVESALKAGATPSEAQRQADDILEYEAAVVFKNVKNNLDMLDAEIRGDEEKLALLQAQNREHELSLRYAAQGADADTAAALAATVVNAERQRDAARRRRDEEAEYDLAPTAAVPASVPAFDTGADFEPLIQIQRRSADIQERILGVIERQKTNVSVTVAGGVLL